MAQWAAIAGAALQRGAALVKTDEVVQATQEKAAAEAEVAKKREAEAAMVGEASATQIDEAMTAEADEAKAVKANERAAPIDTGKTEAEAASTLPRTEDQPGGHGGEREVHTISSDEPPIPHGKGVMDAEVSSKAEMAAPGAPEGPEVEGNWALAHIETDPWAVPVPVPLGGPKEEEEAHWAILDGFENLVRRSLKTALRILTEDLPSAVEVSPALFS
jgi:hypothetical protein